MENLFELMVDISRGYNRMVQAINNIRMCQWPFTGTKPCECAAEYYVDGEELCAAHTQLAEQSNPRHTHIEKIRELVTGHQ